MVTYNVQEIFGEKVCIGGIGRMYFEEGFPIDMSISLLKERGIKTSLYHVADEFLKNGWTPKKTFHAIKDAIEDDIEKNDADILDLSIFCFASYEEQRKMIFEFLFDDVEVAMCYMKKYSK